MARRPLSDAELEATLRDIGARLRAPETPHLAARVRARIAGTPARPARRPWAFALAPAVLTLLIVGAGATATEVVRLRGIDIFRVPAVTSPPLAPLDLGERASLDVARALVIPLRTSNDPVFGAPDEIYLRRERNGQASFVYRARPVLPAGPTGHGALVTQFRGNVEASLIGKGVGPGTRLEEVNVRGQPGIWIGGEAHFFFYRDAQGNVHQETLRLAGNTLLWEVDGTLMRLEAQVSKARALEIAASFR